jgi:hypothetical protein
VSHTSIFLSARFSNVWLLDNFGPILAIEDREILEREAQLILSEYEAVWKVVSTRADETVDRLSIQYVYGNALLENAEFEAALPLLTRSLALANQRYGENSPILLPILRLLAGVANTTGDAQEHERFSRWIARIDASKSETTLFLLRSRATPETRGVLFKKKDGLEVKAASGEMERYLSSSDPLANSVGKRHSVLARPMHSYSGRPVKVFVSVSESGSVTNAEVKNDRVVSTVDKSGSITNTRVEHEDEKVRAEVEKIALGLKFKPLTYNGRATAMKGYVVVYFVE